MNFNRCINTTTTRKFPHAQTAGTSKLVVQTSATRIHLSSRALATFTHSMVLALQLDAVWLPSWRITRTKMEQSLFLRFSFLTWVELRLLLLRTKFINCIKKAPYAGCLYLYRFYFLRFIESPSPVRLAPIRAGICARIPASDVAGVAGLSSSVLDD